MEKKIEVKFPKGIHTVNIPFMPPWGAFGELKHQISRISYPKSAKRIEATITVSYDLKGNADYEAGIVKVFK
jgi:hypothetical protein